MNMGFKDNAIEEIKSRCNIVDVVGRQVVLKKTGNNHKGLCPFHNEKTPSFIVSEDRQMFTCFGCGATGDVIEFTQRIHNLDFPEAIEKLAGEYGIELGDSGFGTESKKAGLYELNREAAAFFYRKFSEGPNPALEYMQKRGLDAATLRKFGIGYADDQWQSLLEHFQAKGTDPAVLLELGLLSRSKDRYYDKFRDRVMFPIINTRGKVIGFGGRVLGEGNPKYLNSPESPVFQKKNNLYGLNLTRQDISKENSVILVEGYMDAVSLYQHGVRNVAATLGTALTVNQATMIKRYTDNIILAYDADQAGQAATLRGMDILYEAGCNVKVLLVSDGKDPDDFIRKNGKEAFLELVKDALPFADYKLYLLQKAYDLTTTDGSLRFLKEIAKVLRGLRPIEADYYIKKVAKQTNISEGAIKREVGDPKDPSVGDSNRTSGQAAQTDQKKAIPAAPQLQRNLLKLMLVKSAYIPKVQPYESVFQDQDCYRIYEIVRSLYKSDEEIDIKKLEDSLGEHELATLHHIMQTVQFADRDDRVFADCISHIKEIQRGKREEEIITLLSVLNDEGDNTAIIALTKELMELQRK
jgi:DNA primase